MLGAIIGDIVGSRFEWNNIKTKEFELFTDECFITDDSIMTLALAKAVLESGGTYSDVSQKAVTWMQAIGRKYPDCGYGSAFAAWMFSDQPLPYNSFGNGAAMRVSAAGYAAASWGEAIELARNITAVTHNHPEGMKGAEATAIAIFMAKTGCSLTEIRALIDERYYPMDFTLDEIRPTYQFNETCQETVPQALMAFFESTSFEDAIRNAISLGGDSDTLAAITGSVAEAYYGVPAAIRETALTYLPTELQEILEAFEARYPAPLRTTWTPGAPWPGAELYVQYEKSVSCTQAQLEALLHAILENGYLLDAFTHGEQEGDLWLYPFDCSFSSVDDYLKNGTALYQQECAKYHGLELDWSSTIFLMATRDGSRIRLSIGEEFRKQRLAGKGTSGISLSISDYGGIAAPSQSVSRIAETLAETGVLHSPEELYQVREVKIHYHTQRSPWRK